MTYSFLSRTRVISVLLLVAAIILIGKLFLVQVVHKNSYTERADRQYSTPSSNIFERRTIFFERKDGQLVSAATQTTGFKLAVAPNKIIDAENTYQKISKITTLDHDAFIAKVLKKNDPYEEVADRLSKSEADAIASEKIPGVSIYKEKWRFYPGDTLASHTLGFVGFKGTDFSGRYGLERQYNAELSRDVDSPYINFFAEVFSNINTSLFEKEKKGGDIITTIEPAVQGFLEKKLAEVKEKENVDSIGGIIMDPRDGSIYALSVKPDFNPNDFSKVKNASTFSNPLVENVLEFGSVVKPLVMASALDAGVVTADTKYNDKGFVIIEKKQINNFDKKSRGNGVTMQEVLNQSLNTGMVYVYQHLGKQNMREYLLSFGIKEKTGIDLPNETSGLVANLQSPRELEYANASFGQGIALTPIEMIRALASLSNGGNLVTPHIAKIIKYDDGTQKVLSYPTKRTKITEKTSEEITRMLVNVMDAYMKSKTTNLEHYSVAVKTGTAQVAKESGGGYYEDRHTHSFFGYFPAYDPKFIVLLYAINPKGVPYAFQTWADPFLDISKFLLSYYEVPPDR
ncbi:MAG: penicillin-binding protein 2 [Minisyncoccia bacterium]